jgi:Tfp pilus assembly protein PilF
LLAPLYDGHGDLAKARTEYEAALRTHTNDADLLNDFACFLDRQGDFSAAEAHLRSALTQSPTNERARVNLGIVLAHQGKHQEAFDTFSGVVGPAAAHSNLGAILAKQGRYAESRQALQSALALNPDIAPARALLQNLDEQVSAAGLASQPGNPSSLR